MDEKAKKQALLMIPYGLFVRGAAQGGKAPAARVKWLTQASFNPPLVVVGIKKDSGSHAMVKDSKRFSLSMLGAGQKPIAGAFFRHVEPKDGKFGDFAFQNGANGAPIITDAPASVECEVVGFYELGDHSIVVGKVTQAHINRDAEPLTMEETDWHYGE